MWSPHAQRSAGGDDCHGNPRARDPRLSCSAGLETNEGTASGPGFPYRWIEVPEIVDGRLRLVACITKPRTVRAILEAMHLPTEIPQAAPARPPPQEEIDFFQ